MLHRFQFLGPCSCLEFVGISWNSGILCIERIAVFMGWVGGIMANDRGDNGREDRIFPWAGRNCERWRNIGGHGRTPRGVEGGGQHRFSKNLTFKRFAAKFFSQVSRRFSEGQKGIV